MTPETRVIATIIPNVEGIGEQPWTRYRATAAEVERRSGYRLLGRVPESVRAGIEVKRDEAR